MNNELTVVNGLLIDIECENKKGVKVYPSQKKGNRKFSVSISGASDAYRDTSLDELIGLFAQGVFDRGAQLRMSPNNGTGRNGQAPNKGRISKAFRNAVKDKQRAMKVVTSPANPKNTG